MAKNDGSKGKKGGMKGKLKGVAKAVVVELFGKTQSGFVAQGRQQGERFVVTAKQDIGGKIKKGDHVHIDPNAEAKEGRYVLSVEGKNLEPFTGQQHLGVAVQAERDVLEAQLQTQKDGRLFAMDLIRKTKGPGQRGEFSAVDSDEGAYTYPPQSPMIREAFERIQTAPESVKLGFWVVMSEYIGQSGIGHLSEGTLEKWEAEGRMRVMPEPSPMDERKTLTAEKGPFLAVGESEAIESFIQDNGPWRRIAMAYLSRPWNEVAEQIQNDRDTAVAFASAYRQLQESAENYKTVAGYIEEAQRRLKLALATRSDMKQVLSEAAFMDAEAQERKVLPEAKFLGTQRDGRKLAVDLLKMIPKWLEAAAGPEGAYAPFALLEHDPDDKNFLWRKGPQSTQIRQAFDVIYKSDEPVRKGFFAVLSDWMGQVEGDAGPEPEYYEEYERLGLIKDVGDDNG